jgi:hypothetical protein
MCDKMQVRAARPLLEVWRLEMLERECNCEEMQNVCDKGSAGPETQGFRV